MEKEKTKTKQAHIIDKVDDVAKVDKTKAGFSNVKPGSPATIPVGDIKN